jgi:hypothetical protein
MLRRSGVRSELESDGDVRVAGETLCDGCVADESHSGWSIREGGDPVEVHCAIET